MKSMIKALAASLVMMSAFAASAQANCDVARLHVVRSEGASGGIQIFDLAPPTVTPTFYYRFSTNNPVIVDNLNSAWVGNFTVRAIGNAAACPAAGVIRNGGTILQLFRDSFS